MTAESLLASEVADIHALLRRLEDGAYVFVDGDTQESDCDCCDECIANFDLYDDERDLIIRALRGLLP